MSTIEGVWKLDLKTPLGAQQFTLTVTESPAKGEIATPDGVVPLEALSISGENVTFEFDLTKPMKIHAKGALTVAGDTLSGTVRPGPFPAMPISGTRV